MQLLSPLSRSCCHANFGSRPLIRRLFPELHVDDGHRLQAIGFALRVIGKDVEEPIRKQRKHAFVRHRGAVYA